MKRLYNEIDDTTIYVQNWNNISMKNICIQRDLIIVELKRDYLQIVQDLETFYPDECTELCLKYWNFTQEKINDVINSTELVLQEDKKKDHKKVHL